MNNSSSTKDNKRLHETGDIVQKRKYEHPNFKRLCHEHLMKNPICPCYVVEKNECQECLITLQKESKDEN